VLTTAMSLTTFISQRQLMSKQAAQVNPQQQMIMRIMPLVCCVFGVIVPLAVIIYWVTTNFWSVGQQYFLLRSMPLPAGAETQAAAAGAPALVDNGEGRKGLGPLSMFRGLSQSRSEEQRSPTGTKNGNRNARAGDTKASPKQGGGSAAKGAQASKGAQAKQGQSGRQGTSGNRRSGSRSSGKGKSSGPRRGKR
jgi:YidC/Oxa1 family membrane protein insertase